MVFHHSNRNPNEDSHILTVASVTFVLCCRKLTGLAKDSFSHWMWEFPQGSILPLQLLFVQEDLEDHLEISLGFCVTKSWQVGCSYPWGDLDINVPSFSGVWDKRGIVVVAHYSFCVSHRVKWQLCSYLAVFVKGKGKGKFCAVFWGFGTGVLACVLKHFRLK